MWADDTIIAFDLETTGKNPEEARIVTATVLELNAPTGPMRPMEWIADPGIPIPEEATEIHGSPPSTPVKMDGPAKKSHERSARC